MGLELNAKGEFIVDGQTANFEDNDNSEVGKIAGTLIPANIKNDPKAFGALKAFMEKSGFVFNEKIGAFTPQNTVGLSAGNPQAPDTKPLVDSGLLTASYDGRWVGTLTPGQKAELTGMASAFAQGPSPALQSRWAAFVADIAAQGGPVDPNEMVQAVLQQSYLEATEDLRFFAEKVKYFNECKKAIRDHLTKLRALDANIKTNNTKSGIVTDPVELEKLNRVATQADVDKFPGLRLGENVKEFMLKQFGNSLGSAAGSRIIPEAQRTWPADMPALNLPMNGYAGGIAPGQVLTQEQWNWLKGQAEGKGGLNGGFYDPVIAAAFGNDINKLKDFINKGEAAAFVVDSNKQSTVGSDLGIPLDLLNGGPGGRIDSPEKMEAEIKKWEEKLNSVGDDAQLANVTLQNCLQKQQQTLQMCSNISKMLHDTAMAIIRKIGG